MANDPCPSFLRINLLSLTMKTLFLLLISIATGSLVLHAQNTKVDRPAYTFSYPSEWKMDTDDVDYDPDSYFAIDIDENNLVLFFIMDQVDMQEIVDAQQDALTRAVMENPEKISQFKKWGAYTGVGKMMRGRLPGTAAATIRIFAHNFKDKTLLVILQCHDADLERIGKGLKLVEESFILKQTERG